MKTPKIYRRLTRWFFRNFIKKNFLLWERLGFHITPKHFYYPIPDISALKDDLWKNQSDLFGINIDEKMMFHLLSIFSSNFRDEYNRFRKTKSKVPFEYFLNNMPFRSVDAEIYYCMIRHFKPERIIEIGAGYSTYLAAQAILKNKAEFGINAKFQIIEPHPNDNLRMGFPGLSKLIKAEVQEIALFEFEKLKKNDILFVDSSHVLMIGSDVQYEYLEILPRLNDGVLIHIHDIFLPSEYPKEWVLRDHRFWNEQYILQAFLTFNNAFEILWAGSYMHLKYPEKLSIAFNSYNKLADWPSSFWIRKKEN
jgi:hypothetical protein